MDQKTINHYNTHSSAISDRHSRLAPTDLYALASNFFAKGSSTLDLGCGMGRDTQWLNQNNFPAIGIDGSEGMIEEAQKRFPNITFKLSPLPELKEIKSKFTNVYCCAVLMHIPRHMLLAAATRILEITETHGRIILSYRGPTEQDERLFENYHPGQLALLFESMGGKVLFTDSKMPWHTMVIEKRDLNHREGIQQIQDIIQRDKKTSTYKFALLRALCEISRYESHLAVWNRDADEVYVPLNRIAARWIGYYLPLIKSELKQTTNKDIAFGSLLRKRPEKVADTSLLFMKASQENQPKELSELLKKIKHTVRMGPIKYSGSHDKKVFDYVSKLDASVYQELQDHHDDFVVVPISIWRDMTLFSHWIEDSLIVQWAEFSARLNEDSSIAKHFNLLTKNIQGAERTTRMIRKLLKYKTIYCTWSGKKLSDYSVDHVIPWSVWRNNDLWNLMPCDPKVNLKKSDFLPAPELVISQYNLIQNYWDIYRSEFPDLFEMQTKAALGNETIESLLANISRVSLLSGARSWTI